jgi:hypothetical protein
MCHVPVSDPSISFYNGPPDLCRPLCSDTRPCAAGECIEFDKEIRYCYVSP